MSNPADFLFELGTEELPPGVLARLAEALSNEITTGFEQAGLGFGAVKDYAAPRRLAVWVQDLADKTEPKSVEKRGPAVKAAFDADGNPTRAATGFAQSVGTTVDTLERMQTDKGEWLVFRSTEPGRAAADLIPAIVSRALDKLPTPKRMRWGDTQAEFIRPVHWLLCLHGSNVVPFSALEQTTGNTTRGHRFHHPEPIAINQPAEYAEQLQRVGYVMADFVKRRAVIEQQVLKAAQQAGGQAQIDASLLDEVTALVEWPQAIAGSFEQRFLEVPHEALISAMQDHQKYFPVVDEQGELMPWFVTVANIESRDIEAVRTGNERVIRPRFADAMFFWDEDRRTELKSHQNSLKSLVFQKRLGSVFDKLVRVEQLAAFIAEQIQADISATRQAARLCKCDLQTQMVGEFPELQGVMGAYLARHEGISDEIACALEDHYLPRRAGDGLPRNDIGRALALADRLDTLMGIFAIGQPPTGAKDPFALRRAALGVLRIIIEQNLDLDLHTLLQQAATGLEKRVPEAGDHVLGVFEFITERQHAYSTDRGIRPDVFQAVSATGTTRPLDFEQRMQAVNTFLALPEAAVLAAANKRISNILRKNAVEGTQAVNPEWLQETAEKQLHEQLLALKGQAEQQLDSNDFTAALNTLAGLAQPVDAFFDQVMVMADDPNLKANRIALLQSISGLFMRIADIGQLQR